jgi:hypothetical protein
MGLRDGRHDALAHCASYRVCSNAFTILVAHATLTVCFVEQSLLRCVWNRAKVGATQYSSTNGVDYYASLFALELVAFFMYARLDLANHRWSNCFAIVKMF